MHADRRRFLRTAAGLLVPAAPVIASPSVDAAEAERNHRRRRKRRSRNRPPQMFADDVVATVWNGSGKDLGLYFTSNFQSGNHVLSRPDTRTGYNPNIEPWKYGTDLQVDIISFRARGETYKYRVILENPEVGAPDVGIQRWAESKLDLVMADDYDLGEGDSVSRTDGIVRIKVHRDRDGEISEDGNDEEYCRFGISISLA